MLIGGAFVGRKGKVLPYSLPSIGPGAHTVYRQ